MKHIAKNGRAFTITDLSGVLYGRLRVLRLHTAGTANTRLWLCVCSCGTEKPILGARLLSGKTKSCGCLRKDMMTTHGLYDHASYNSWHAMMARCYTPSTEGYYRYGGRGIKVCDRWKDVRNFVADMGYRTKGCIIDRKDNDGNYTPENCKWSTPTEQANNRTTSVKIKYKGVTDSVRGWAERTGLSTHIIYRRRKAGLPIEDVLSQVTRRSQVVVSLTKPILEKGLA